jgi:hypothetical protein
MEELTESLYRKGFERSGKIYRRRAASVLQIARRVGNKVVLITTMPTERVIRREFPLRQVIKSVETCLYKF